MTDTDLATAATMTATKVKFITETATAATWSTLERATGDQFQMKDIYV